MKRTGRSAGRRPMSIAARLTVFYALSASALLFISSLFLYGVITSDLETQDTKFLADEVEGLRAILKEQPGDPRSLEQEINWEGNASKLLKYYVVVFDEDSNVIAQTNGANKIGGNIPFPNSFSLNEYPNDGKKWKSPGQKTYLLMSAWAQVGPGPQKRLLRLAYDITDDEALVSHYRDRLFIVLVIGVVLASGIGALTARRGLKPLLKITNSIRRISVKQLHERINQEEWPSELISLADAFDQMLDRLEDSFNRLSQFSADLAHELRTPINNLMGETEVSLTKSRGIEEYRQVLESNLEESGRVSRMIDNLLFLARAENPETLIEKTVSEAAREIGVVVDYYDAVAKEKEVKVVCVGEATLTADFNLFRRAMSNVFSNALKHSKNGGTVTIHIKNEKDGSAEVTVADQGEGIAESHITRIFDRFYRADSARRSSSEGMGLGLAIVKSIMKLHGGTVLAQSVLGRGTTIILRFPAS